jgi:hypothetical protein
MEPKHLFKENDPNNNTKPDIIVLDYQPFLICLDVSITNPVSARIFDHANMGITIESPTAGLAAHKMAENKRKKYEKSCDNANYQFCPIIMETQGLWHDDTKSLYKNQSNFMKRLVKYLTRFC